MGSHDDRLRREVERPLGRSNGPRLALIAALAAGTTAGAILSVAHAPAGLGPAEVGGPAPAPTSLVLVQRSPAAAEPAPLPAAWPPSSAEEPAPAPPPRASTPLVNPDCLSARAPLPDACGWDDGLPAISADGRLVARWAGEDEVGDGFTDLTLELIDTTTSRKVRAVVVATGAELEADAEADDGEPRVRSRIERRAAAAQRVLDAGRYRSLDELGAYQAFGGSRPERPPAVVHAELDGELVRAIDPAAGRVLWQRRFHTPPPARDGDDDGDDDGECGGWSLAAATVWWDAPTRTALVAQTYHHGGCMCGSTDAVHVARF